MASIDVQKRDYYVYIHINLDNDAVFYVGIGQTSTYKLPYARAFNLKTKERNYSWGDIFYRIKTGISIRILEDNLSLEECKDREKYWISFYGRLSKGEGTLTNIAEGGDDNKPPTEVLQYSLDGVFIKKWKSVPEISSTLGLHPTALYSVLEKQVSTRSSGGFLWSYFKENSRFYEKVLPLSTGTTKLQRKVYQFDAKGNFIAEYTSVTQAAKENGIDTSSLFKCIKKQRKMAKGFYWSCVKEENNYSLNRT
jgi:hypothetical protein